MCVHLKGNGKLNGYVTIVHIQLLGQSVRTYCIWCVLCALISGIYSIYFSNTLCVMVENSNFIHKSLKNTFSFIHSFIWIQYMPSSSYHQVSLFAATSSFPSFLFLKFCYFHLKKDERKNKRNHKENYSCKKFYVQPNQNQIKSKAYHTQIFYSNELWNQFSSLFCVSKYRSLFFSKQLKNSMAKKWIKLSDSLCTSL